MGEFPPDIYIYFRTWNVERQEVTYWMGPGLRRQLSFDRLGLIPVIEARHRIYNNGGAQILAPK